MVKKYFLILLSLFSGAILEAQLIGDMISERECNTISTNILFLGVLQVETGYSYLGDKEEGVERSLMDYNTTLIRVGIKNGTELRFKAAYSGYSENSFDKEGFSPIQLGVKTKLVTSKNGSPDIAIIGTIIPSKIGSDFFRNDYWGFDVIGAFRWKLRKKLLLTTNAGVMTDSDFSDFTVPFSAALGFSLGYKLNGSLEFISEFDKNEPKVSCGYGMIYKQSNDFQFYGYCGKGINDAANDWSFNVGLSFRFGPLFR